MPVNNSISFGGFVTAPNGQSYQVVNDTFQTGSTNWSWYGLVPQGNGGVAPAATPASTIAGITPNTANSIIFGKAIPLFVGGKALIGGNIVEGPFFDGSNISFIASLAVAANPNGTRTITSVSLNGTVSWTAAGGSLIPGMSVNVKTGTETQTPFASSLLRYSTAAIAYRPHILVEIVNCPLASFGNVVPFASGLVEDSTFGDPADGITRNDALTVLANYAGYSDAEIDIDVGGLDTFWIVAGKTSFIQLLQSFRKVFPTWNVVPSDKLYVFENDGATTDAVLTRSNSIAKSIAFMRDDPLKLVRERVFGFIDVDRDNEPNTAVARLDITPITTTQSIESETVTLPIGTTASQAMSDAYTSLYFDKLALKKLSATGMLDLLGIEAGDAISFTDDTDIAFAGLANQVARNIQNWTVDIGASQVIECVVPVDPYIAYVVLLLGFNGADGSTTIVDESPSAHGTAGVFGNAQKDTSAFKFGTAALITDGTNDGISFPDSDDWQLSDVNSDQFTVEAFVRMNSLGQTDKVIVGQHSNIGYISWYLGLDLSGELEFQGATAAGSFNWGAVSSGISWTADQWYHVAADKDSGGKLRLYRDGVMVASSTPANSHLSNADPAALLTVGSDSALTRPPVGRSWDGWIDEVRITKGIARYASDSGYTVPTAAFPRV